MVQALLGVDVAGLGDGIYSMGPLGMPSAIADGSLPLRGAVPNSGWVRAFTSLPPRAQVAVLDAGLKACSASERQGLVGDVEHYLLG